MSARRRWRRLSLVAVVGVIIATAAALWMVRPWEPRPAGSSSTRAQAENAARMSLQRLVPGQGVVTVALNVGFEAATYDQAGDIDFWVGTGSSWDLQAVRTYSTGSVGQGVIVSGALLPDMPDATFVVNGPGLTGDGSGDAAVYTRGKSGWGVVAQQGGSLVPTGGSQVPTQDAFFGAWLLPVGLRTSVQPTAFASTSAGSEAPLVDYWRWHDGRFTLARSNTLTAVIQPAPRPSAPPLPWGVPRTGTYGGILYGVDFGPAFPGGTQETVVLFVMPGALNSACLRSNECPVPQKSGYLPILRFTLDGQMPLEYAATTSAGTVRVSGPAWFLAMMDPYPQGNSQVPSTRKSATLPVDPEGFPGGAPSDYTGEGAAPWYIPSRLGLKSFAEIEGYVQLTFKNDVLTHAAVY
jgi:hypothetical protein